MIHIQSRRECFFDGFLIDEDLTTAETRLHKPVRRNVLLELNQPWEGRYTTFFNPIFADGKWRMYYTSTLSNQEKYICCVESDDAQHWLRPDLGIVEFQGPPIDKPNPFLYCIPAFAVTTPTSSTSFLDMPIF